MLDRLQMGLGKTVQTAVALALLLQAQRAISRAIIVTPASLTLNWMNEIARWTPSITARRVVGDARSREAYYLLPIPVIVASYEQVRFDALDRIPSDTFDLVVLDEAQRIKNSDSATAFACRLLPRSRSWALSATPLENAETDVASILKFLEPGLATPLSASRMQTQLETKMLRRRKSEVRAQLPPVLIQDLELDLTSAQRTAYDEIWFNRIAVIKEDRSADSGAALLALITRLKLICNFEPESEASSKLDALRAIVEEAGDSARILVFSQYVKTLEWMSPRLDLRHNLLTGAMTPEARSVTIDAFNEGRTPRVLLVSLRAGGVGLNLGDATHVVLFDRWWNPAVENQAIYRAHRFDRDMPLHVIRFLVQDTIEEQIARILAYKEKLFADVVEGVDPADYHFTREELLRILDISPEDLPWASKHKEVPRHVEDH